MIATRIRAAALILKTRTATRFAQFAETEFRKMKTETPGITNDKVPAIEYLETKAKSMLLGGYSETDRISFDSVVRLMAHFGLSRWADGYSVGITEGMEEVDQ